LREANFECCCATILLAMQPTTLARLLLLLSTDCANAQPPAGRTPCTHPAITK
jgi:hypothetical protein